MEVNVSKSDLPNKKLKIVINDTSRTKTLHIGERGAMDFIKWNSVSPTKALERRTAYDNRHRARENWTKSGMFSNGFWAKWLLWNKPTLEQSKADIRRRFNLNVS